MSAMRSMGARFVWPSRTTFTMRSNLRTHWESIAEMKRIDGTHIVSPPIESMRTCTMFPLLIVPRKTRSPACFLINFASPVNELSSNAPSLLVGSITKNTVGRGSSAMRHPHDVSDVKQLCRDFLDAEALRSVFGAAACRDAVGLFHVVVDREPFFAVGASSIQEVGFGRAERSECRYCICGACLAISFNNPTCVASVIEGSSMWAFLYAPASRNIVRKTTASK